MFLVSGTPCAHAMHRSRLSRPSLGTATLEDFDQIASAARGRDTGKLKKSKNGIILVPQPSDDPQDPLVWHFIAQELGIAEEEGADTD